MYLTEVSSWEVVKKQYQYKLRAYIGVFSSLVVLQFISIFFSLNGSGMSGGGSQTFEYSVNYYSGDIILVFMMIWAFMTAIIITTRAYRYDDFSFVTNRVTSHFSNILFLLSVSVLAGITVFLSSHLFRLVAVFVMDIDSVMISQLTVTETLKGFCATVLYVSLFGSIGYFVGVLIQINRLFSFILPVTIIGVLFTESMNENPTMILTIVKFFGDETLLSVFTLKVMLVSIFFYGISILISNRMEVRL